MRKSGFARADFLIDRESGELFLSEFNNLKFLEGSKKSIGSEKETCILFDKDVVSRSIPTLFCEEDDIERSML